MTMVRAGTSEILHPPFDAPARVWIDAGLAAPSPKGRDSDFDKLSFTAAQANALLYLTGKGAHILDREGKRQQARP